MNQHAALRIPQLACLLNSTLKCRKLKRLSRTYPSTLWYLSCPLGHDFFNTPGTHDEILNKWASNESLLVINDGEVVTEWFLQFETL